MNRWAIVVLVFLVGEIQAQCIGFVNISYDSINGSESWQPKDSLFIINAINERRSLIDETYDSIVHFSYQEKEFCLQSDFCKEIDKVNVEAFLKDGKANRIVIFAKATKGKLTTQYYYWEDKIFAIQSFEYLPGKAPKEQWLNANGVPGWEVEVFICDYMVFSAAARGTKKSKKSQSDLPNDIMFDLVDYSGRIISQYLKTEKKIDIDYASPFRNQTR